MDISTLNAAIACIQAKVDATPVIYTPECMDDAHEDGLRDGLILARIFLQEMLKLELEHRDDQVATWANRSN